MGGFARERRLVIVRDKRRKVIFLSCRLHLLACHSEHERTDAHTNKHAEAAAMHVNELSMEQWQLLILMNINEQTKIEDGV